MGHYFDHIARYIGLLSYALSKVAIFCILGLLALIGYDVFSRYVLNKPVLFSDELSSFLLVAIAFLGAPQALRMGKHINVEVVTILLSANKQRKLLQTTSIISCVALVIFCVHCFVMVYLSFTRGVTTPSVLLSPLWIPQFIMLIGVVSLTLQMIVETITLLLRGQGD